MNKKREIITSSSTQSEHVVTTQFTLYQTYEVNQILSLLPKFLKHANVQSYHSQTRQASAHTTCIQRWAYNFQFYVNSPATLKVHEGHQTQNWYAPGKQM